MIINKMEREYVYKVKLVYDTGASYFLKNGKLYSLAGARGQANRMRRNSETSHRLYGKSVSGNLIRTEVIPYILMEAGKDNQNVPLSDDGEYTYIVRE